MNKKDAWPELPWHEVVDHVAKSTLRVRAGSFAGTGFVVSLGSHQRSGDSFAIIATAWHVIADLPGRTDDIVLTSSDGEAVISSSTNPMGFHPLGDARYDTGLIVVNTREPIIDVGDLLPLFPFESVLARGADIGWLGFPGLVHPEMCFFGGHISGSLNDPPTYLVDGVAINGVSGGPVFDKRTHLIGMVSAYIPNRIDDHITLPGLLAVTPINAIRYWMESILEATVHKRIGS